MLHVALAVLMAAAFEDLPPRGRGGEQHQVDAVLELIAKADGPAALVQARPPEQAADARLIRGPDVHHVREDGRDLLGLQPSGEALREGLRLGAGLLRLSGPEGAGKLLLGRAAQREQRDRLRRAEYPQGPRQKAALKAAGHGGRQQRRRVREKGLVVRQHGQIPARLDPQTGRVRPSGEGLEIPHEGQAVRPPDLQQAQRSRAVEEHGRLDLPARDALFPDRQPRRIADLTGAFSVREEADRLPVRDGAEALAPLRVAYASRRGDQAHLARVLKPQPRGAEVGGEGPEPSVGQDVLPDARRQRPLDAKHEALLLEAPERHGARALRRDRPRHRQRRGRGSSDEVCRAAPDGLLRLRGQEEDAAPRAQQGLEAHGRQQLFQPRKARTPVGPGLLAQEDELRLQPAAFEQAEGAQQLLALPRLRLAAEDGQLARDAPAPERAAGAGVGETVLPQRQHQLHRPADLRLVHPEPQRRPAQHRPGGGATLREHASRPGEGRVPGGGKAEREMRPRLPASTEGELSFAANTRVRRRAEASGAVGREAQRQVGAQAEPELLQSVLRQAAQQQPPVALLRLQAELPVRPVVLPIPHPRQHGRKAQRERQRPVPFGPQREQQALAELARRALALEADGGALRLTVEAAALLAEGPAQARQIRQGLAAELEGGAVLGPVYAELA